MKKLIILFLALVFGLGTGCSKGKTNPEEITEISNQKKAEEGVTNFLKSSFSPFGLWEELDKVTPGVLKKVEPEPGSQLVYSIAFKFVITYQPGRVYDITFSLNEDFHVGAYREN